MGVVNTDTKIIYKEISRLSNIEKITLLSKLIMDISKYIEKEQKSNIYDIKGVGKEIWNGIDAQEYVNKERASWK